MEGMKNVRMPAGPGAGRLAQVLLMGGAAVYGLANSLFNVEGGHRWVLHHRCCVHCMQADQRADSGAHC